MTGKTSADEGAASARADITERLTKTLVRIRLAKLKQIVERTGHLFDDVQLIKKMPIGWRIGPARPFPLKPNQVELLTQEIRATHYPSKEYWEIGDDPSTHTLCREAFEYLDDPNRRGGRRL